MPKEQNANGLSSLTMPQTIQNINSALAALLLGAMPLLLLTPFGHASTGWYVLVAASLIMCFTRAGGWRASLASLKPYRPVLLALSVSLLPALLFMLIYHVKLGAELERAARPLLGCVLVLAAALSMKQLWLRQTSWGFALAGWAGMIYATWPAKRVDGRPILPEYNAVSYGNLLLLLGVMLLFSTKWQLTRWPRLEKTLKWLSVAAIVFGFIQTQTRTGWLGLPVFGLIWLYLTGWVKRPGRILAAALALVVVFAAVFAAIPTLRERATKGYQEVTECVEQNHTAFSSTCIRLQLWRSAFDIFLQHPWLGTGKREGFQQGLQQRVSKGLVSQKVADEWGEAHSDMLMVLATQGALGGLALLLVYFAPAWMFIRRLGQHVPPNARIAAAMGLSLCLGFAIFGLSELMFRGMRTVGFYAVMIGWLLALSDPSDESAGI